MITGRDYFLESNISATNAGIDNGRRDIWFKKINSLPVIIFMIKCPARSIFN